MSSSDPFDLERLRRNWERAADPEPLPLSAKATKVRTPENAYAEARTLLAKVRKLGLAEHPSHRVALVPFLDRADAALDALTASAEPDEAIRQELLGALLDLEDLFDVFGTTGR